MIYLPIRIFYRVDDWRIAVGISVILLLVYLIGRRRKK